MPISLMENKTLIDRENERLISEASEIIKVVAQRWSKFTTGEKALNWLVRFNKLGELKDKGKPNGQTHKE